MSAAVTEAQAATPGPAGGSTLSMAYQMRLTAQDGFSA